MRIAPLVLILAFLTHLGAEVVEPFKIRYQKNVNGATEIIGNTLLTAPKLYFKNGEPELDLANDAIPMQYVTVNSAKRNASSATLTLKEGSKVLFAGLYWGARSNSGTKTKGSIEFKTPQSGYQKIEASNVYNAPKENYYSAFAEVTKYVQLGLSGSYTVANVDALTGADCFAGWALVVVYENDTMPLRSMTLFDGYAIVPPSVDIVASGFHAPKEGLFSAYLSAIAFEGDTHSSGDALSINGAPVGDAINEKENFFNSRITKNGQPVTDKKPNYTNQLGFDIKQIDVTGLVKNGDTKANVSFITNKDYYQPVALVFVTDYDTDIAHTQTSAPKGPYKHGDRITMTSTIENKQTASAYKVGFTTDLLGAFDYVQGSMKRDGKPLEARIENDKLFAVIDKLDAKSKTTVTFDVQIKSPAFVRFGSNMELQSTIDYHLEELGVRISVPSDSDTASSGALPTTISIAPAGKSLQLLHTQTFLTPAPLMHGATVTVQSEISNLSKLDAQKATFTTQLPEGVTYVPNSCYLNDQQIPMEQTGALITARLGTINPQARLVLHWDVTLGSHKLLPYETAIDMTGTLNYEVSNSGVKSALVGSYNTLDGTPSTLKLEMTENLKLKEADRLYNEHNYTAATPLYEALFFGEMDSIEYNHKLAKSAHKMQDFDTALAAYDRLLILDERPMYYFELAEVYIDLAMLGDAKSLLLGLKKLTSDEETRKTVLLARIEELRPRHNFFAVVKLGGGYDDNLNASPGTTALSDYYANELNSTLPTGTPDRIGDTFYDFMGTMMWLYDMGVPAEFYMKSSLTLMSQNFLSESNYNLLFGKVSVSPGYKQAVYDISVPIEGDHVMFGGANLVSSFAIAPTLDWTFNKEVSANAQVKYQQKSYAQSNLSGRNNRNFILGGGMNFKKPDALIGLTYRFQNASKTNASSTDTFVEYTAHSLGGSYTMTLPNRYELGGNYTLRFLSYTDAIPTNTSTLRFDILNTLSLSASKTFFQKLKTTLSYAYTSNGSNYNAIDYMKNKIQLSAQTSF